MKLFNHLEKCSNTFPYKIVLEDDNHKITYKQLYSFIGNNRRLLLKNGINKCIIAYKITTQFDFIIDFLSLLAIECWVIPISPDTLYYEETIKNEIKIVDHTFFLRNDNFINETFQVNEETCGIYHMTSGTTSSMKLCERTLSSLVLEGLAYKELMNLNKNRIFSMAPIYHSFALGSALFASLVSSSCLKIIEKFSSRKAINIISQWKANNVIGVPVMINSIANVRLKNELKFPYLLLLLSGTGNVTKTTVDLIKKRFGIDVSINYGSTETGGLISRIGNEPHDSIGKEMLGVQIKLINKDGLLAKYDEPGEAYVRCQYMMNRYVNTKNVFIDGYFPTGDILKKDINGYYYFIGRTKNIINIGGKKVYPTMVQNEILSFPNITDCVVKKEVRKNGDELIHALVVGKEIKETKLRKYLSSRLSQYQIPTIIEFVDQIQRNDVGKYISKRKYKK